MINADAVALLELLLSHAKEGRVRSLACIVETFDTPPAGIYALATTNPPKATMLEGIDLLVYDVLKLKTRRKPRKKKGAT